jgi:origin recognition complex subunit 3
MATEDDNGGFDAEDPSYRACYVFRPAASECNISDDRPRKKRKIDRSDAPTSGGHWPRLCNGAESQELADLRQESFNDIWTKLEPKLEEIADEVDEASLQRLDEYIERPAIRNDKLHSAIVVSENDANALRGFLGRRKETRPHTIHCELQATQASNLQIALKSVIKDAIVSHGGQQAYIAHLAKNKRAIPMLFDLELLQIYMEEHGLHNVVLGLTNAEMFDLNVLSELISQLESWKDRLSFSIILSLVTTVSLFESRMSRSVMRLLDTEVFSLASSRDKFFDIFSAAQLAGHGEVPDSLQPLFGSSVTKNLFEMAQDQSVSTHSFIQAIKYCFATHYFANSLTAVLSGVSHINDVHSLCEGIRNTKSFQEHCTNLLNDEGGQSTPVHQLLSSDSELIAYTSARLKEAHLAYMEEARLLQVIAIVCHHLDMSQSLSKHYYQVIAEYQKGDLEASTMHELLSTRLPMLSEASMQTLIHNITPLASTLRDVNFRDFGITQLSPMQLLSTLRTAMKTLKPAVSCHLSEALLVTKTQLSSNFLARPRSTIFRALAAPTDYLGCECCTSSLSSKGKEGVSILYRLLEEAGREVNVMDLWSTFHDNFSSSTVGQDSITASSKSGSSRGAKSKPRVLPQTNGTSTPAKSISRAKTATSDASGNGDTDKDQAQERASLAHFYVALATLKYLGLVKSTSDRRLNKGVEVLSKVAWHGL